MIYDALLWMFAAAALGGGVLMLVARHPMRVALALITTMLSLAALFAMLDVHVIAVFQVLIYVGAVMVFMVYAIMLLDVRDASFVERYSSWLWPGVAGLALLAGALIVGLWQDAPQAALAASDEPFRVQPFSVAFLNEYWLYFELTSVLLLAAVVAAIAILNVGRRRNG